MSNKVPLVSVLMTVYNRESYIREAIESVIQSTFSDWELIIVDDQSSDRSFEIAISYGRKDKRIRAYKNEKNLGDYPNRNKAASYARGKYLKYLDSDDLIYPYGLEIMVNSMETNPSAGLGVNFNYPEMNIPYPFIVQPETVFKQQFLGTGFFATGPTGAIIKKAVFDGCGGMTNLRYSGDLDSWLKFSQYQDVVVFQPGLIWWRKHETQEFQLGQGLDKYHKSNSEIYLKYILDPKSPFEDNDRTLALELFKQRQARKCLSYLIPKLGIFASLTYFKYSSIEWSDLVKGLSKSKLCFDIDQYLAERALTIDS